MHEKSNLITFPVTEGMVLVHDSCPNVTLFFSLLMVPETYRLFYLKCGWAYYVSRNILRYLFVFVYRYMFTYSVYFKIAIFL